MLQVLFKRSKLLKKSMNYKRHTKLQKNEFNKLQLKFSMVDLLKSLAGIDFESQVEENDIY